MGRYRQSESIVVASQLMAEGMFTLLLSAPQIRNLGRVVQHTDQDRGGEKRDKAFPASIAAGSFYGNTPTPGPLAQGRR